MKGIATFGTAVAKEKSSGKDAANRLSATVLAGGKGSRFGGDKSGIRLQGKSVLEDLVEKFRAFPFERIALVRAP